MENIYFNTTGASSLASNDRRALDITIEANLESFTITHNRSNRLIKRCRMTELSKINLRSYMSSNWIEFYFEDGEVLEFTAQFSDTNKYKALQHQLRLLLKASKTRARVLSGSDSQSRLMKSVELLESAGVISNVEAVNLRSRISL